MQSVNLCKEVLENAIGVHETCEKCGMETQPLDVVAVQAMKDLLQYREIGTPEECRAAMEKQPVFNMDKVVEQLKALTGEECTLHECGIRSEHCKACIAKKAIDIVKAGGVDG